MIAELVLFGLIQSAKALPDSSWDKFCQRYLVMDDPYEYEDLSVEQLVRVYFIFFNQKYHSRTLIREIKMRLAGELSPEDREILTKTLANEDDK